MNDRDCYVANFWRALQADPEGVAVWADWPVNEADLHSKHLWLVGGIQPPAVPDEFDAPGLREAWLAGWSHAQPRGLDVEAFRERMMSDPDYYDLKVAGWWVWGLGMWIGAGWCVRPKTQQSYNKRPALTPGGGRGVGVHSPTHRMLDLYGRSGAVGKGIHSARARGYPSRQMPHLNGNHGAAGSGIHASGLMKRTGGLVAYFQALAERLRRVRVCCGDWTRVLGPSVTEYIGVTGILLDPPYSEKAARTPSLYREDDLEVAHRAREWAIAHGDNPLYRIAFCGYEGEHEFPATWECVPWKANGGYSNSRRGSKSPNATRERIWFSPHCLHPTPGPSQEGFSDLLQLTGEGVRMPVTARNAGKKPRNR